MWVPAVRFDLGWCLWPADITTTSGWCRKSFSGLKTIHKFQKMFKTSKNHWKSTVTQNEINYIWKMIRKIQGIWIWHFHACLNNLTSLFSPKHDNALFEFIVWIWIWTLSSNQRNLSVASCIRPNHVILPCHDHASYCALHWLCSSLFAGNCPLSVDVVSDDVIDDTDEELHYLQKCQASNPPYEHYDTIPLSRSCSLLLH